jgi:hypothetical protein
MQEGQEPTGFTMPDGLVELIELERQRWPIMQAALRASSVPLNEGEGEGEGGGEGGESGGEGGGSGGGEKPPWGDDENFDPAKAWKLIQNVRGDVEKFKSERDTLAKKVKEHEDSSKSASEKLEERASTAEQQLSAAQREAARLRIALKKGLTETQAKRLVGDTEEELEKDADELLESFKDDNDGDGSDRRTPKPRMRTGAAPSSEPEETDPEKLAASVPRR